MSVIQVSTSREERKGKGTSSQKTCRSNIYVLISPTRSIINTTYSYHDNMYTISHTQTEGISCANDNKRINSNASLPLSPSRKRIRIPHPHTIHRRLSGSFDSGSGSGDPGFLLDHALSSFICMTFLDVHLPGVSRSERLVSSYNSSLTCCVASLTTLDTELAASLAALLAWTPNSEIRLFALAAATCNWLWIPSKYDCSSP